MNYNLYRETPFIEPALDKTLYATIRSVMEKHRNEPAIGFLGTEITYGELFANVDTLADAYHKAGIGEGDTVAVCTINMPIVQENLLALSKLGAVSKWIDLRIKGSELVNKINENQSRALVVFDGVLPEILEIADRIHVEKILVASPKDYLKPAVRLLASLKEKKHPLSKVDDSRIISYAEFIKTGNTDSILAPAPFRKDRVSLIIQSSGSTGVSKSIVHTEYNFNSKMLQETYSDLPLDVAKTMHVSVPPFIIYGLCNSVYAALYCGMKAEMSPYVAEDTVFNDLGKFDLACAAPVHYRFLYKKILALKDLANSENSKQASAAKELKRIYKELKKVIAFVSGGDAISPSEILNMQQLFGVQIINGYGNNEVVGAAIVTPRFAPRPDSIGIPLKGVVIVTVDDNNNMLPSGEIGEICIASDNLFLEYVNNPAETAKIKQLHSDGNSWIHTGDIGYSDADGYVYITGRNKRLIKRAAFKIAPETIENVVLAMPEITDCCVVGVADELETEVPYAFIQAQTGVSMSNDALALLVLEKCREMLPEYEVPVSIHCMDAIPYKNNKHNFAELERYASEKRNS